MNVMSGITPDESIHPDEVLTPEEYAAYKDRKNLESMFGKDWPEELPGKPV